MKLIKRILGITDLIKLQNETNHILANLDINLAEIIRLQKHSINNDCSTHEHKKTV